MSFDFVGARDLLKRAIYADPNYAMAHSALASTFLHLGDDALGRSEAKIAVDQSQHLPEEFALAIRGQYEEITARLGCRQQNVFCTLSTFPGQSGLRASLGDCTVSCKPRRRSTNPGFAATVAGAGRRRSSYRPGKRNYFDRARSTERSIGCAACNCKGKRARVDADGRPRLRYSLPAGCRSGCLVRPLG